MVSIMAVISGIVLLVSDKTKIHLAINGWHSSFADFFFKNWTYVGDGIFVAVAGLAIAAVLFPKYKWVPFWFGASTLILSGVVAQLLKRFLFEDALRPSAYLTEHTLYLVEGVQMHTVHSFPSGHTTAAFAFFAFASAFLGRKSVWIQILFAVSAGLVGYSRMYLSQHFLEDVFAGMILGSIVFIFWAIVFKKPLKSIQ